MKKIEIRNTDLSVPNIALGCMRYPSFTEEKLNEFIHRALDLGMNFFDHADLYGGGVSEEIFGNATKDIEREKMILQSKCGILKGRYDSSKEHILESVDNSLRKLNTDYLDLLLLHRPDALMEPEEIAEAFDELKNSGKVRYFGVSNFRPSQIELLKKYISVPLVVDQLQFSLPVSNMVASGMEVNMDTPGSFDHDGSVLDYCRISDILIQAWSPFQSANWQGPFIDSERFPELNQVMDEMCHKYDCDKTALAAAWILRHPAKMQVIAGTTNINRLDTLAKASEIVMSREDWYRLYLSAGHILP